MKIRRVIYEDITLEPSELMTVSEAAKVLNMSMPGVISAIKRGVLSEVIDESKDYHGRRLVLAEDVARLMKTRGSTHP